MKLRRRSLATLALILGILGSAACGEETADEESAAPPDAAGAPADAVAPEEASPDAGATAPIPRIGVTLWFPSTAGDALVGDGAEIFSTADPGSRAKQIVVALLGGPKKAGALPALPTDTTLRQVYVLEDGTAWVDFSSQLRTGIGGGSSDERLAVYAVVDSVALNVPEITRVGFLVEGNPVLSLNGHMDLRRPLPPDRSILSGAGVVGKAGEGA